MQTNEDPTTAAPENRPLTTEEMTEAIERMPPHERRALDMLLQLLDAGMPLTTNPKASQATKNKAFREAHKLLAEYYAREAETR